MTQPQSDPAADIPAALARLAEQAVSFQRQIDNTHTELVNLVRAERELTAAEFVTYRTLIDSQAEKVKLALDASNTAITKQEIVTERALNKQETATEKRFESVNEFRGQLSDLINRLLPRSEAEAIIAGVTARIRELADSAGTAISRQEAVALADRNSERIQELTDRINRAEGANAGAKDNKTGLYAALGFAVSLIVAAVIVANFLASRK